MSCCYASDHKDGQNLNSLSDLVNNVYAGRFENLNLMTNFKEEKDELLDPPLNNVRDYKLFQFTSICKRFRFGHLNLSGCFNN